MEKSPPPGNALYSLLEREARAQGFPVSGSVDVSDLLAAGSAYASHVGRYRDWLARGMHGEMAYLARGDERRADPRQVLPDARAIFCVAMPYGARPVEWGGRRIARYARGPDYHQELARKLEQAAQAALAAWTAAGHPPFRWKVCVDTSAVLERSLAALAGLGWIGKNTLLIHPQLGSYVMLAEVLLDVPLERAPRPLPNYCGQCSRCLEACPTQAFTKPGDLDSRKCISYQTLEYRGEFTPEEAQGLGNWVAGCDVCQEVCPFNQKATRAADADPEPANLPDPEALAAMTDEQIRAVFRPSSLSRIKPAQWRRNLEATKVAARRSLLDPDSHQP